MQTTPVSAGGVLDASAGGDTAVQLQPAPGADGVTGVDLNGTVTAVDFRSAGLLVYGFGSSFVTSRSLLATGGDGEYLQQIDATRS